MTAEYYRNAKERKSEKVMNGLKTIDEAENELDLTMEGDKSKFVPHDSHDASRKKSTATFRPINFPKEVEIKEKRVIIASKPDERDNVKHELTNIHEKMKGESGQQSSDKREYDFLFKRIGLQIQMLKQRSETLLQLMKAVTSV